MAKRTDPSSVQWVVGFAGLVFIAWIASIVAAAWRTWYGRLALLATLAGLIAASVIVLRWVRERRRIRAATLGELLALTPARFEQAVGQLLRTQGHGAVRVSGRSGDQQADVTARTPDGRSVIVQCKRYSPGNKVGSPAIQSFIGMAHVHHRADLGMFVTTSTFTEPARKLAKRHKIQLVDGPALVQQFVEAEASRQPSSGSSRGNRSTHLQTSRPPPPPPPPPQRQSPPPPPPTSDEQQRPDSA